MSSWADILHWFHCHAFIPLLEYKKNNQSKWVLPKGCYHRRVSIISIHPKQLSTAENQHGGWVDGKWGRLLGYPPKFEGKTHCRKLSWCESYLRLRIGRHSREMGNFLRLHVAYQLQMVGDLIVIKSVPIDYQYIFSMFPWVDLCLWLLLGSRSHLVSWFRLLFDSISLYFLMCQMIAIPLRIPSSKIGFVEESSMQDVGLGRIPCVISRSPWISHCEGFRGWQRCHIHIFSEAASC